MIPFDGGERLRTLDLPAGVSILLHESGIRWTADGKSLIYIGNQAIVSNVLEQPLIGGASKQLTNFEADTIFSFDLSRDGKDFVFARISESSDAVLISNFR